jgi:hypothetical protein
MAERITDEQTRLTSARLSTPLPRPAYVILHNGPIKAGDRVRVIELGEPIPDPTAERLSFATAIDRLS